MASSLFCIGAGFSPAPFVSPSYETPTYTNGTRLSVVVARAAGATTRPDHRYWGNAYLAVARASLERGLSAGPLTAVTW